MTLIWYQQRAKQAQNVLIRMATGHKHEKCGFKNAKVSTNGFGKQTRRVNVLAS